MNSLRSTQWQVIQKPLISNGTPSMIELWVAHHTLMLIMRMATASSTELLPVMVEASRRLDRLIILMIHGKSSKTCNLAMTFQSTMDSCLTLPHKIWDLFRSIFQMTLGDSLSLLGQPFLKSPEECSKPPSTFHSMLSNLTSLHLRPGGLITLFSGVWTHQPSLQLGTNILCLKESHTSSSWQFLCLTT